MKVNRARLRELAEITLEREEEHIDYRTSFDDEEAVAWVEDQLKMGNLWAWCSTHVVAEYEGLKGEDWLGGCSYESKADFMKDDGYYGSMVDEAVEHLAQQIEKLASPHGLFEIEGTLCLQCIVATGIAGA